MSAGGEITIAAAANTPLYLPLYIAHFYNFFGLNSEYRFRITSPERPTIDHDSWAAGQLQDEKVWFAVCDPTKAAKFTRTSIVATMVNRAAFWAVSRQPDLRTIADFAHFKRIYTYPKGMTAFTVATAIKGSLQKQLRVVEQAVDTELEVLLSEAHRDQVVITANLLYAKRFVTKHAEKLFRISEAWSQHPMLSSFMLTGLITRRDTTEEHSNLVTGLVWALSKACSLINTNEDMAVEVLMASLNHPLEPITKQTAQEIVREFKRMRIFPVTPFPELASWHNAFSLQGEKKISLRHGSQSIQTRIESHSSYDERVRFRSAGIVELNSMRTLSEYGQGDIHSEAIERLVAMPPEICLGDKTVVGAYRRHHEQTLNVLKEKVSKIKDSLFATIPSNGNVLIWAGSGSGKSYLVEQCAAELGSKIRFVHINLAAADMSADNLRRLLLEVTKEEKLPCLCLIDEIDCETVAGWSYDVIYPALDLWKKGRRAVFAMTGSSRHSVEELRKEINDRTKGPDCMTRTSWSFDIPPATIEDKAVIVASHVLQAANDKGKQIKAMERLAVYYLAVTPELSSTRKLAERATKAVLQVIDTEDKVRYDDLFDHSDSDDGKLFWAAHMQARSKLGKSYLRIEA